MWTMMMKVVSKMNFNKINQNIFFIKTLFKKFFNFLKYLQDLNKNAIKSTFLKDNRDLFQV